MAHLAAYLDDWRFTHSAGGPRVEIQHAERRKVRGWAGLAPGGLAGWLASLLVLAVLRHTRLPEDSALGVMLSSFFGFGIALLTFIQHRDNANQAGLDTSHISRLGLPDRFVEHAERHELLHDLGLDEAGITKKVIELVEKSRKLKPKAWSKERTA